MHDVDDVLMLTGEEGERYAIPRAELDQYRVPDELAPRFDEAAAANDAPAEETPEVSEDEVVGHFWRPAPAPPRLHLQWFRPDPNLFSYKPRSGWLIGDHGSG